VVNSGHDGVEQSLQLLLFSLKLSGLGIVVSVGPILDFLEFFGDGGLFVGFELVLEFLVIQSVLDADAVAFQGISGLNLLSDLLILVFESFGLLNEVFDVLFRESSLVVGDGDLGVLGGSLISGSDVHDTILIDFE
jgi:hypothetical protein